MTADPYYGTFIEEGFFVNTDLYVKYEEEILETVRSHSWHERAGKHSETEVDHVEVILVTESNLYDLSMIDLDDYMHERFYDFMTEEDSLEFQEDQSIRMEPKEMVTITKDRYEELLEMEAAYKLIVEQ